MATDEQQKQLNNFSTIVSIMAVVVSLIITLGGYFATNATIVEKIDRLEKIVPKLETTIEEIEKGDESIRLQINTIKGQMELKSAQHLRDSADWREYVREWKDFYRAQNQEHLKLQSEISELKRRLQKFEK